MVLPLVLLSQLLKLLDILFCLAGLVLLLGSSCLGRWRDCLGKHWSLATRKWVWCGRDEWLSLLGGWRSGQISDECVVLLPLMTSPTHFRGLPLKLLRGLRLLWGCRGSCNLWCCRGSCNVNLWCCRGSCNGNLWCCMGSWNLCWCLPCSLPCRCGFH